MCLIDIRLSNLIWLTWYKVLAVSKKHLDVKLALDFTKKINLNVLFYKGLKIEGLELSLKKNTALFYEWEETRHGNKGKERQIKIKGREKKLVVVATLRLHQHHATSWKEGLTKTILTTSIKADIKDQRKSRAVPP
jgi:hypothetical protein